MSPHSAMPVVADRLHPDGVLLHQLADEGFGFRCKRLLLPWTIDAHDTNGNDFGFVTYRQFVAAPNGDHLPIEFRFSRGNEAWWQEAEQKKENAGC